jgi:hypothetical protein
VIVTDGTGQTIERAIDNIAPSTTRDNIRANSSSGVHAELDGWDRASIEALAETNHRLVIALPGDVHRHDQCEAPVSEPESHLGQRHQPANAPSLSRSCSGFTSAFGGIADIAGLAAGSTRSRMTPNGHPI